jgi:hypothetical protein
MSSVTAALMVSRRLKSITSLVPLPSNIGRNEKATPLRLSSFCGATIHEAGCVRKVAEILWQFAWSVQRRAKRALPQSWCR